jgi:hypothetical protein
MFYFILLIGIVILILGMAALTSRVFLRRHSVLVDGTVVDLIEETLAGANPYSTVKTEYRRVAEFIASNGQKYSVKGTSESLFKPVMGERVPIRYYPRNPSYAAIASAWNFWLIPIGATTLWIVILIFDFLSLGSGVFGL